MNEQKVKITGHLLKNKDHYVAVWLINNQKHTRTLHTSDRKEALEEYNKIIKNLRRKYDKK